MLQCSSAVVFVLIPSPTLLYWTSTGCVTFACTIIERVSHKHSYLLQHLNYSATMGRRLQAWGNQDLRDQRLNQIIGPLKATLRRLRNPPQAWKSIPQLLAASLEDANARIARTQDLLDSQTGLPDDSWYSRRPIGAGSYGVAALFEKVGHNGQVVDVRDPFLQK